MHSELLFSVSTHTPVADRSAIKLQNRKVAISYHLSKNCLLMILQTSSATAAFSRRNFSAASLSTTNEPLIQYPHPSFTITPIEEAISKISDSWQIPFPNLMSMPASFKTAGANLFLMTCTDMPIPVACKSRIIIISTTLTSYPEILCVIPGLHCNAVPFLKSSI
jgi:hypothetical protein